MTGILYNIMFETLGFLWFLLVMILGVLAFFSWAFFGYTAFLIANKFWGVSAGQIACGSAIVLCMIVGIWIENR